MAWTFKHIPCEIGALEAEEIGVEHLLRDIKDTTVSTLAQDVSAKVSSLRGLKVRAKALPMNLFIRPCRSTAGETR